MTAASGGLHRERERVELKFRIKVEFEENPLKNENSSGNPN